MRSTNSINGLYIPQFHGRHHVGCFCILVFACMLSTERKDATIFQTEIVIQSIGWSGDAFVRVDRSNIIVFKGLRGTRKLLEVELPKKKANEISSVLRSIPFSEQKSEHEPGNGAFVNDGVRMDISARLSCES